MFNHSPTIRIVSLVLLLHGSILLNSVALADSPANYEEKITGFLRELQEQELDKSLQTLQQVVEKYPNSKLGQLLMADMLASRAGVPNLIENYASDREQLNGLRDETLHRWRASNALTPAEQGMIPLNLIASAPTEQYVLAADAQESRLYVYENLGSSYQLVADYFMTIGRAGMGKDKEGDLRTPEGVYFVTSYLPGEGLPPRYGPGAFPINYPNEFDKKLNRTGYGIWIHGTEPENYNRVPLASDGCLSLSNEEFLEIKQYISTDGSTPVIISQGFDWIDPQDRNNQLSSAKQLLAQWEADWESLETDQFISHYSPTEFKNYTQFANQKRKVNQAKSYIEIDLNNVSIYDYPGDESMLLVSFDQEYRSDNHHSVTQKKQYWKKREGRWEIIYEG